MTVRRDIGARLLHIRAGRTLPVMAAAMGVAPRTYSYYEQGERTPDAESLIPLVQEGWNVNWLLTGQGPERLEDLKADAGAPSQAVSLETLKLSVQLAQEALDGATLEPDDYGQLVRLIYDALAHGLPSAQVIALARPAARGISGVKRDEGSDVGGPGKGAAGSS